MKSNNHLTWFRAKQTVTCPPPPAGHWSWCASSEGPLKTTDFRGIRAPPCVEIQELRQTTGPLIIQITLQTCKCLNIYSLHIIQILLYRSKHSGQIFGFIFYLFWLTQKKKHAVANKKIKIKWLLEMYPLEKISNELISLCSIILTSHMETITDVFSCWMNKNVSFTFQRLYPSGLREQIFMPGHHLQLTYINTY